MDRREYSSLPVNTVAAKEFYGPRFVTQADMPAGHEETAESTHRTAEATEKMTVLMAKLVTLWQIAHPGQDVPSMEVITSKDW